MAGVSTKVGGKCLAELKKHKNKVLSVLGVSALLNLAFQHYEDEMMGWILLHFGRAGRWLLGNPCALFTIPVLVVIIWILWIALNEAISQSESALVGPRREKLYIPKFSPAFIAGVLVVGLAAFTAVAYGAYRYYKTPFPIVVASSGEWFAEHYKGADVYAAIRIKN